jgi:hypothetical protein
MGRRPALGLVVAAALALGFTLAWRTGDDQAFRDGALLR